MPNRVWADPLEACYDTELLDALLGMEEGGSATGRQGESSSVFSKLFMVGGSLFSRRRAAATARAQNTRLRGAFLSWLDYGSIYCPFTKQFVSLHSTHWSHLSAAGFGIDSRLRHGRCVVLVSPETLEELAHKVQEYQTTPSQKKGNNSSHPLAPWSPLLRESLGGLFQTVPGGDGKPVVQRVREILHDANCTWTSRSIPLSFYGVGADKGCTFQWTPGNAKDSATNGRRASTEEFMRFGESYLHQCLKWRASVLQHRKKITSPQEEMIAHSESTPASFVISPPKGKATDLIDRHSTVNVAPFVVPNSRLAYLSLTYNSKESLLEVAVKTILEARLSEEVFYCPLEHCIDYNSLMDVEAYRLRWGSFGTVQLGEAIPLLHLGMHTDPSRDPSPLMPLVVIGNAHLLSKRAIARLLEQWTRNGLVRNTESHHLGAAGRGKRGILLRTSNTMRTVDAGAPLFGNIHALFVGYSPSLGQTPVFNDRHVVADIQGSNARVRVLAPVSGAMFFIEEPLVSALKRVAPRFQNSMSGTERAILIEELCGAMSRIIVPSVEGVKYDEVTCNYTTHGQCTSGTKSYASAEEEDILFRLQEACEAFLSEPVGKQDAGLLQYEQLLHRYPRFSAMRVRHDLLHECPLKIEVMENHAVPFPTRLSESMKDVCEERHFTLRGHCAVVESRRCALELAGVQHDALKRACVVNRAVQCVSHALTGRCVSGTASSVSTDSWTHSSDKSRQLTLEQRYDPFFEPPVLLGYWTRTLLFCAPKASDMLPLRRRLYCDLLAAEEQAKAFGVVDVDVFHVDYVSYPPDRRCCLFGIRLRYDPKVHADEDGGAREAATSALQDALVKSAVEARLFPIWTHDMSSTKRHSTREQSSSHECAPEGGRGFSPHFCFEELDECVSAAVPNLVERRIFALAMAQRGPMLLTIGTPVVALRTFSRHITRGMWCRVVRFVPINELPSRGSSQLSERVGSTCQGAADLSLARRYFHQQRGSSSVPVLQPMMEGAETVTEAMETAVLPAATLVGGYRSLHYYALPTVQLPLLAPCQHAAASMLFHPLFAHEDSLMEFVSMESRAKAVEMLLPSTSSSSSSPPPQRSGGFLCDAFFEDVEPSTRSTTGKVRQHEEQQGSARTSRAVHSDLVSALSLFPLI